ncbi:hypothetical protein BU17DRAFT_85525 [Hysterangium stoloniferum]|nr:hypothetical protein BU17DRAFT_85525 [Hysterangium stoloniferum]
MAKSPSCQAWLESQDYKEINLDNSSSFPLPNNLPGFYEEPEEDSSDSDDNYGGWEIDDSMNTMDTGNSMDSMDVDCSVGNATPQCIPNPAGSTTRDHTNTSDFPKRYYKFPFSNVAKKLQKADTPYEKTKQNEDPNAPFFPFATEEEWQLANWLGSSGLPNTQIDKFLNLPWVNAPGHVPSFKTSSDLINRIEALPGLPPWNARWITLPEAPKDPQLLLYRDPVECLKWLEANPELGEKDYVPYEEYVDGEGTIRCYSEIASGEAWNELQRKFPNLTINPFIMTTDSTHLTQLTGDKKVKPLLISSAHIRQNVRAKPSKWAFLPLAFIPEGKFSHLEFQNPTQASLLPGILSRHLYHMCMREVMKPVIPFTVTPIEMVDSEGYIRKEILAPLFYIADTPEQALVAGLAPNNCIPCLAGTHLLDADHVQIPRTGQSILDTIKGIRQEFPDADTWKFAMVAKERKLNGVEEPWWIDFPSLDICKAVCPDVLHGLHKAFKDHCVAWHINLVGKLELHARFRRLPKFPGFRHFTAGISKISQWTGKEHRDLQRSILPALVGAVPSQALRATRAELDFIYMAQYRSHTEETLSQLMEYNKIWHLNKNIFITTGARRGKKGTIPHFRIPKLHTRPHYPEFIRRFGATTNFTTETPERYHIEYAKKAYRGVSKKDYTEQMVRWLDRQEKLRYFERYIEWRQLQHTGYWNSDSEPQLESDNSGLDPEFDGDTEIQAIPFPTMTYEPKLAQRPSIASQEIMKLMKLFSISPTQFQEAVKRFEAKRSLGSQASGRGWDRVAVETGIPSYYKTLDVWKMFRITLPVLDSLHDPIETRIIRAALGKKATVTQKEIPDVFDIVLVDTNPTSSSQQMGLQGLRVAQLRMIFRPAHINLKGPHPHPKHLAYVEWFDYDGYNSDISMYAVQKSYGHSGHQTTDIIELDQVVQPCPLSPCFGEKASNLDPIGNVLCGTNTIECVERFWINSFHTKATFQTVF